MRQALGPWAAQVKFTLGEPALCPRLGQATEYVEGSAHAVVLRHCDAGSTQRLLTTSPGLVTHITHRAAGHERLDSEE